MATGKNDKEKRDPVIIVFGNHKGGVGKTTLALNTADGITREGYSVLMIDLDPQGNMSEHCKLSNSDSITLSEILVQDVEEIEKRKFELIQPSIVDGAMLVRSCKVSTALEDIKRQLENKDFYLPEKHIGDVLKMLGKGFDVVLIDTPPNLGTLTTSALMASDYVVIPIDTESTYAMYGSSDLIEKVNKVRHRINPKLVFLGVVINKLKNTTSAKIIQETIRGTIPAFDATIRATKDVAESQIKKATVLSYARSSRVAQDIVEFSRELLLKVGLEPKKQKQATKAKVKSKPAAAAEAQRSVVNG